MKWIKNPRVLIAATCLIVGALLLAGYTLGQKITRVAYAQKETPEEAKDVTAKVKVTQARYGLIEETVSAFGTVIASPEDIRTISVPFECRVRRVRAVAGQAVEASTKLIDVEPSPDAALALSEARSTQQAAERDLAQVQQRLEMKLATKAELSAAQQAMQLAQSRLDSLEKRGLRARDLIAGLSGLVSRVDVQEGQIAPAGSVLVEVVPADRVQVKLGIEPSQADRLKPGQVVHLETIRDHPGTHVDATMRLVTRRINPASRLVDAYVALPSDAPLMLETFVRAQIVVGSRPALIVPRSAVLPAEGKHVLFTLRDGKAVEHEVGIGLEDETNIELLTGDIQPGDRVVTQGNAELKQGMAIEAEKDQRASTQTTAPSPLAAEGTKS
jgi:membrane fusion protein (multidrug efflux system)